MNRKSYIVGFLVYHIFGGLHAINPSFTFFIRQYPGPLDQKTIEELKDAAHTISISRKITRSLCPRSNQGIIVTYAGYTTVSNFNGQVTFPRMQQAAQFTLIITPEIKPIFMIGNTIHHWELIPGVAQELYTLTRKENNPSGKWYWHMQKITHLTNNVIPLNAIVIHSRPAALKVFEGLTPTTNTSNLLLPDIYALKGTDGVRAALQFLKTRMLYGPIRPDVKKQSDTYFSTIFTEA